MYPAQTACTEQPDMWCALIRVHHLCFTHHHHSWLIYVTNLLLTLSYLYFSLVCEGMSLLEYCFEREERSPSPLLLPPRAGSNVGLAAVVILSGSAQLPVHTEPEKQGATLARPLLYYSIVYCMQLHCTALLMLH